MVWKVAKYEGAEIDPFKEAEHVEDPQVLEGSPKAHELSRNNQVMVCDAFPSEGDEVLTDGGDVPLVNSLWDIDEGDEVGEDWGHKGVDNQNALIETNRTQDRAKAGKSRDGFVQCRAEQVPGVVPTLPGGAPVVEQDTQVNLRVHQKNVGPG